MIVKFTKETHFLGVDRKVGSIMEVTKELGAQFVAMDCVEVIAEDGHSETPKNKAIIIKERHESKSKKDLQDSEGKPDKSGSDNEHTTGGFRPEPPRVDKRRTAKGKKE